MKFQLRSLLLIIFLVFIICKSEAQVKTKTYFAGIPSRLLPSKDLFRKNISIKPAAEFIRLKKAVETDEAVGGINRYALPHNVNIDVLKEATLIEDEGVLIYSLIIEAKAAYSLSLRFREFNLSENSTLSIFTNYEITDTISSKENNKKGTWSTRSYHGDLIQIVLRLPSKEKEKILLKIGQVYLGYKMSGVSPLFGSPGSSASCMKNVACPEGAGWDAQRNAVALIDANGAWGTGTMIMNTCGTNTPYLLTAQHGLDGDEDDWNFQFFYFSTDCNSNTGYREDIQFHGAVVRAANTASDFALLQLNQTPAANSGIHYAGWNRTTTDFFAFTSTTLLHHPKGDVMKISRDNNGPQSVAFRNSQYWKLELAWGGVQGGSSGGPFLDANRRIIGQVFGVLTANAGNPCHPDVYGGRFDFSWTGGGTNATRLSNWLDPTNSGAITTNTTNVANLVVNQMAMNVPTNLCTSGTFTVSNLPAGATVAWSAVPANSVGISQSGNTASITNSMSPGGYADIIATITYNGTCQHQLRTNNLYFGSNTTTATYTVGSTTNTAVAAVGVNYVPPSQTITFTINNSGAINSFAYSIQKVFGNATISYLGNNSVHFSLGNYSQNDQGEGTITLLTTATTNCGDITEAYNFTTQGQCYGCRTSYSVTPNPGTDKVKVKGTRQTEKGTEATSIYRISIYNQFGTLMKALSFAGVAEATVDVSNLKTDVYILKIFNGKSESSERLVIAR